MRIKCFILFSLLAVSFTAHFLHAQCTAAFTYKSEVCAGTDVQFNASDTSSGLSYLWDFGDIYSGILNSDTVQNPKHYFKDSGVYSITLIVTNGTCTDTQVLTLQVYTQPKARFLAINNCNGLSTWFQNQSTYGVGDSITKYEWNLDDSVVSFLSNPSRVYNTQRTAKIRFVIETRTGCTDTINKTITIYKKPIASRTPGRICQNGQIDFTADTIYNALKYQWDFGDSSGFAQRQATHVYNQSGIIRPKLTVQFAGANCTIGVDSVLIYQLPNPSFYIPVDTFCFNNNNACVVLKNMNQSLIARTVSFDDGFVFDAAPFTDSIICHNYTDTGGGSYAITVELIDTNNCVSSATLNNAIVVHSELRADFNFTKGNGCFKTGIDLLNISNRSTPFVQKFTWDFGDGSVDTQTWLNPSYTYTTNGSFLVKLFLQDQNGCSDSFQASQAVTNTNFVVDARIDTSIGICHNYNFNRFVQTPVPGASITWYFRPTYQATTFTAFHSYNFPGVYQPWVIISKNGCDSIKLLDSIVIHGPVARMGNIQNRFQCQVKDTVYFSNNSILFRNQSAQVFWDAGDFNGSYCTTDSKNNLNTNSNCRYSRDSMLFKHMYAKGVDTCYYSKLVVRDTVIGCADSIYEAIALMPPKAKGLFLPSDTTPCPGYEPYKVITFNLGVPKPQCIKYAWWVMWDSLSASKTNDFDSNWVANARSNYYNGNYQQKPGDSNGYVTVGLIVENGSDSLGKICRDTGWFHHIIQVARISPNFTSSYNPKNYYCPGTTFTFSLKDSQQHAQQFYWDFGDGTYLLTGSQNTVSHTFKRSGAYRVRLQVFDTAGCSVDSSIMVNVGFQADFAITSSAICTKNSFQLLDNNRYFFNGIDPTAYWSDTSRTNNGKEAIYYDLGDGVGFQNLGASPVLHITAPGVYNISMAAKDSTGCTDTVFNRRSIVISGIYAGFDLPADTVLCAQTLKIFSNATVTDSVSGKNNPGDYITNWEYDFGSQYPKSTLMNPARYFATGNYPIRQIVINSRGCRDTMYKNMVVTGPIARFSIVSDTIGCAPLKVIFDNQSANGTSYSWVFNDIYNNILSTNSDTNVTGTYLGYGDYYPQLVARGSFTQNNVNRVCSDIFPDTSLGQKKIVTVWELPRPNFTWVTNCATGTTRFTNTSALTTGSIVSVDWNFGDGTVGSGNVVDHTFADTGTYRIVIYVSSNHGCTDSLVRNIVISPQPIAWFGFTKNCIGTTTQFRDSSIAYNDKVYRWNWQFGDNTSSTFPNPTKLFGNDTTYNVQLTITNIAGCSETITRPVTIYSRPKPVFNFKNVCDKNDVVFSNSSYAKQNIIYWEWNFGDGNKSQQWNDTHLYAGVGNYPVKLILKTEYGCTDSLQKIATIHPNPTATISIPDVEHCLRENIILCADSSKIISGFTTAHWNMGNTDTINSKYFQYKYSNFGTYSIKLISSSGFGCKDSAIVDINIHPNPKAMFGINTPNQCIRYNQFLFADSSTLAYGTYQTRWWFGDGNSVQSASANYNYTDTGRFLVQQTLISDNGCTDTSSSFVRIHPMPKAAFSANDSGQCLLGHQFIFTNLSTVPPSRNLTYNWYFGDGNNTTAQHPQHIYNSYNNYNVLLTATSNDGCTDTTLLTVQVFPMPIASFGVQDSAQCFRQNTFTYQNNSSVPYGNLSFAWNFGDGFTNNSNSPVHVYGTYGSYVTTLITTTNEGCKDTVKQGITVHPMPIVKAIQNKPDQCINAQQFDFIDSSNIATGFLNRKWNFGDSTFSNQQSVQKTYLYPGSKVAWLIQFSNKTCGDSALININVYPKPYPFITVNDTNQCLNGNQFVFGNGSVISNGSLNYEWNFGDLNSSFAKSPMHTYATHGSYYVGLKAISNQNCTDSATLFVKVYPMPVAGFGINDTEQCLRQNAFLFSDSSTIFSGSLSYAWLPGDGSISNVQSPAHIYSNYGTYNVQLIANSTFNCADTILKTVVVNPMPFANFSINDTAQCINNQSFVFTDLSSISTGLILRNWVFSDSNSTLNPLNRTFQTDSNHNITLVQLSDKGCMDSITRLITVHSKPMLNFAVNDTQQCLTQNEFLFNNLTTINKGFNTYLWTFGDGTNSMAVNPTHKFISANNYTANLRATSEKNCTDTLSLILVVNPMPIVNFTINDTGQCINNQQFVFSSISTISKGTISPTFKFGDGTFANSQNTNKVYAKDTSFAVWLIETSNDGCVDSMLKMVDVYPKPLVAFSVNDSIQCLRQNNFGFTNQTQIKYGTLTYLWQYNDGNTSVLSEPNHVFTSYGNYTVNLAATSNLNCRDTLTKVIVVGAMPLPGFAVNDLGQCIKTQNFVFTNTANIDSGTIATLWNFGDMDTAQSNHAGHYYSSIGTFKVNQILTSNYGCMDSIAKTIWVNPNSNAFFTTNDSDQCENQQNFTFQNASTIATGNIKNITWNLGNGNASTAQTVNAYYPVSGFYRIQLTTESDSACVDSFTNIVRVYPKPAAWFDVNDSAQCLFQNQYIFTDQSFDSVGVNIYKWNINNELVQTTKTANYTFASPGFKNITLISVSLRGCSDTINRRVFVKPMPDPNFEPLKTFYCENTGPYAFVPRTPGGTYYGKNIINNEYQPVQLWQDTIKYIVTVNGCTDSSMQYTQVYPGPQVNLGNDTTLCKYEILEYTINSWQSTYVWDNGSTNAMRRITTPGRYFVTATNICGVKSDTVQVEYRNINCRFFVPTAFTPNADGLNDGFKPIIYNVQEMEYTIYNRWGGIVFKGNQSDTGWDGTYMGELAPSGSYVIDVSYKYDLGYRQVRESAKAVFQLIR